MTKPHLWTPLNQLLAFSFLAAFVNVAVSYAALTVGVYTILVVALVLMADAILVKTHMAWHAKQHVADDGFPNTEVLEQ